MEDRLVDLAHSKFGELTGCEEKLLQACANGDLAFGDQNSDEHDPVNDPARSDNWTKDREIELGFFSQFEKTPITLRENAVRPITAN
jgi:hypothetical protein